MAKVARDLTEIIGRTPLVRLNVISDETGVEVLGKLEACNPGGSIKDRAAYYMVKDAENKGILKKGSTIIESTSGNTGIALALICAIRGYRLMITMPDTMSVERRNLLRAYGAQVILTPGKDGMKGAIATAEKLRDETEGAVILGQFDNPANAKSHFETTAVEIWEDLDGKVDAVVAGVGTGGTFTGIGSALKKLGKGIEMVAVEPDSSAVLSNDVPGPHGLQGIGAGFIPKIMDVELIDHIVRISDEEAFDMCKRLAKDEGIMVGISSGAAVCAAVKYVNLCEHKPENVVVILPDRGERYLSTPIWQ